MRHSQDLANKPLFSAPEFINWNYCYPCNLKCEHCYSRSSRYPRELGTEQYVKIANTLADSGVLCVAFGGGEPLIRNDLSDIVKILSNRGVETFITTNGWFLTDEIARELKQAGLSKILVSLDHANEFNNDSVRGKDSYRKALDAMVVSLELGIKTTISCVVSKMNYLNIDSILRLGESMGVSGVELKKFRPTGNGFTNEAKFTLSQEEGEHVRRRYDGLMGEEFRVDLIGFKQASLKKECACGWRSACLRPNGDLCHCPYTETVLGNLMDESLSDIWFDSTILKTIRDNKNCEGAMGSVSSIPVNALKRNIKIGD